MRRLEHLIPPPVIGGTIGLGMWLVASAGMKIAVPDNVRLPLAAILALVGVGFDVAGLLAFRRARTTINPLRPQAASALVSTGVYKVTRNPMYVGMLFMLLAWTVYLSSVWGMLGPGLFVCYMNRFQIGPEEQALRRLFGQRYTEYERSVPRWLWIRGKNR